MLNLPETVSLFSLQVGKPIAAELIRLTRAIAAQQIDGRWWSLDISGSRRAEEGDHHWNWRKLVGAHQNHPAWESLAIQTTEEDIQGAMMYRIDAFSNLEPGKGAIYVDRLSTAPRNRPWLVPAPAFRGVGSVLLLAAVRQSYLLGLEGRVWLSSLPSEKTREFYRKKGFEMTREDVDGMIEYELPASAGQQWLEDIGYL